jgi:ATP phosphoribosyltransferase regulatory subunit
MVERLVAFFASYGYERIKPPLIEFEDSLLGGSGAALANQTFRLMDPVSQRMLALRPDMTTQIARIGRTRMANRPRPLRLGYAGQVVRVKGSQLRTERQFGQAGAEIIGATAPTADAEVILMAAAALGALGISGLTVDLGLPTLVPAIFSDRNLDNGTWSELRAALDRKDEAAISGLAPSIGEATAALVAKLVATTGPAEQAVAALMQTQLPPKAASERDTLVEVFEIARSGAPELTFSLDPVESRVFEYHSGVTFTLFARKVRGELGRGGRYFAATGDGDAEPATGVTLFMDSVVRALPIPPLPPRVFLPVGTLAAEGHRLRAEGWITVAGLEETQNPEKEAARLRCSHVFLRDGLCELTPGIRLKGRR